MRRGRRRRTADWHSCSNSPRTKPSYASFSATMQLIWVALGFDYVSVCHVWAKRGGQLVATSFLSWGDRAPFPWDSELESRRWRTSLAGMLECNCHSEIARGFRLHAKNPSRVLCES